MTRPHCTCGRPISAGWTTISRRGSRTTCLLCETARTLAGWTYAAPVAEPRQPSSFDRRAYQREYMRAWRAKLTPAERLRVLERERQRQIRCKARAWREMVKGEAR